MTADPWTVYMALIAAGIFMLGAEIYLPGGVLGVLGSLCLIGAIIAGFSVGPQFGMISAAGIVLASVAGLFAWVHWFPRTQAGKKLTLSLDSRDFKATSGRDTAQPGAEGVAETALRPSGIAMFGGRRVDVVSAGEWIEAGTAIRVSRTTGARVEVEPAAAPTSSPSTPP